MALKNRSSYFVALYFIDALDRLEIFRALSDTGHMVSMWAWQLKNGELDE